MTINKLHPYPEGVEFEKDKSYVTIGIRNYLMCNVPRLLTRKFVAAATEGFLRSSTPASAEARPSLGK